MTKTDWHPADIIAALRKRGTSLAAVSREAGLSSSTLANALVRPWPRGELLISRAIGVDAADIWPERYYDSNGKRIDRESLLRHPPQPATKTT
ncbi:helix-turn-helix domain-containing protein [Salmonella enterica subsp. enterica]|nr:transcriptional regulator [Salmonella enterica subsp. enterica serovar Tanger]EDS5957953.1 transcriptional regulator [Salmonella enterica subsp. enterica]EDY4902258.1 transcriptional regulator [Salmonella enterica]EBV4603613.1 transcriptional regulator [Salmonella enterica subsp. enterica serovar Tanger]EDS6428371.1 transcriptional regulator [Salmonella enterica subsp. enterica]